MGKNNRCKAKRKKPAPEFSLTPQQVRQAEAELDAHVAQQIRSAGALFMMMHAHILMKKFAFSEKMVNRFLEEQRDIVIESDQFDDQEKRLIVQIYTDLEKRMSHENMVRWFGELPEELAEYKN